MPKRKFAIDMAREFGTLTAKNALLYLEGTYPQRKPKAVMGPGSLWGPGATVGKNLVEGGKISSSGKERVVAVHFG